MIRYSQQPCKAPVNTEHAEEKQRRRTERGWKDGMKLRSRPPYETVGYGAPAAAGSAPSRPWRTYVAQGRGVAWRRSAPWWGTGHARHVGVAEESARLAAGMVLHVPQRGAPVKGTRRPGRRRKIAARAFDMLVRVHRGIGARTDAALARAMAEARSVRKVRCGCGPRDA
jgi:hypothetical protein